MELVSHVANEHVEEEEWNVKAQSTPKSYGEAKVSSKSLLDKFLQLCRSYKETVKYKRQYTGGKVLSSVPRYIGSQCSCTPGGGVHTPAFGLSLMTDKNISLK